MAQPQQPAAPQQVDQQANAPALKSPAPSAQPRYLIAAYVLIAAGGLIGWLCYHFVKPGAPAAVAGLSAFAVFYVAAQAIERFIEPLSEFAGGALGENMDDAGQPAPKTKSALVMAALDVAKPKVTKNHVAQFRSNATVVMWGVASFLGMLVAGSLGLLLLRTVGISKSPSWVDILVTGLAIGGGTKPLHDLIGNISAAKESKQDSQRTAS